MDTQERQVEKAAVVNYEQRSQNVNWIDNFNRTETLRNIICCTCSKAESRDLSFTSAP